MKTMFMTCRTEVKASGSGAIEGYASAFGGVDSYNDTIEPTAFDAVLAKGDLPRMFFNHDSWGLPVGKWDSMEKDEKGLYMRGRINTSLKEGADLYEAVKFGSVDGLSIGYCLADDGSAVDDEGVRHIKSIAMLPEVSVVTFPADSKARITDVKAALEEAASLSDIEKILREAGFSRDGAKAFIARTKQIAVPGRDVHADQDLERAAERMRQIISKL